MTHSAHREKSTVATNNGSAMSRDHVKYQPLKSRSKPWIVAHSLFSNSFVRKWGFLCIVLCCLLGFLFYQRVLYVSKVRHFGLAVRILWLVGLVFIAGVHLPYVAAVPAQRQAGVGHGKGTGSAGPLETDWGSSVEVSDVLGLL